MRLAFVVSALVSRLSEIFAKNAALVGAILHGCRVG